MAPFDDFCGKVFRFNPIDVDLLFDFNMVFANPNFIGANAYGKYLFVNKPITVMRNFLFTVQVKFDIIFLLEIVNILPLFFLVIFLISL